MGKKMAFLTGLVAGGFLGWVVGILSAPQSGRETLDTLGQKAIELTQYGSAAQEGPHAEVSPPVGERAC